jgi:hypothetical protein
VLEETLGEVKTAVRAAHTLHRHVIGILADKKQRGTNLIRDLSRGCDTTNLDSNLLETVGARVTTAILLSKFIYISPQTLS